jgi:hypothetical protein
MFIIDVHLRIHFLPQQQQQLRQQDVNNIDLKLMNVVLMIEK